MAQSALQHWKCRTFEEWDDPRTWQTVGFAGRSPGLNVGSEAKQLPGRLLGCQRSSKPVKLQKSLQLRSLQINSSQVISLKLW